MAARKRSSSGRKKSGRKYGKSASKRVGSAMRRRKKGTLKSGSGRKVKSRKQAIAIGLSEARAKGGKVPRKRSSKKSSRKKSSGRKKSAGRKSSSR
jgi:hypothetical protein